MSDVRTARHLAPPVATHSKSSGSAMPPSAFSVIWDHPDVARLPTATPKETSATQHAVQAAWRLQVLATFHVIW
jgi:hypothetical protein